MKFQLLFRPALCTQDGIFEFAMLSEFFSMDEISEIEKMADSRRKISSNGENVFLEAAKELKTEAERIRRKESGETDLRALINSKKNKNNI